MKRLRALETYPQAAIEQASKVVALFKVHTPPYVLAEALQGNFFVASRQTLAEECNDLAEEFVELDPYTQKRTLESA